MAETDLWFGTLSATVRVEDLPASRQVVAIERQANGDWRVCGQAVSNASGIATLPITGLPTSRIYAVAIDDWGRPFVPGMTVAFGDVIRPTQFIGWMYQVTTPGVLPGTEPEWWNSMAGIPQPVGTAMMQAIRHYQPIAHGPVSDIEWEQKEFDPYWDNVVALLHFDGDVMNERSEVEASLSGTVSFAQDVQVFGQSVKFTSSQSGYITLDDPVNLNQGAFTIELWVCPDVFSSPSNVLLTNREGGGTEGTGWALWLLPSRSIRFGYIGTGQPQVDGAPDSVPLAEWTHVAVTLDNDLVCRIFINGMLSGQSTFSGQGQPSIRNITIGRTLYDGSNYRQYGGYIDELRITKGVARYTENFDPPTAPFPNVGPPL